MSCSFPVGRVGRDYAPTISLTNVDGSGAIPLTGTIAVNVFAPGDDAAPFLTATLANGKIASIDEAGGALLLNLLAADVAAIGTGYGGVEVVRTSSGSDTLAAFKMQWINPGDSGPPSGTEVNCASGNVEISVRYDYDAAAGAMADHVAASDPHPQYLTESAATATYATLSDIAAKAPLASPALTGTPTAPTAAAGTNTTQLATTAFVKNAVDDLVAAAPGALDTLDELSAALGDDANFAVTMTNALAGKEASGTAASAVSAHVAASDPHTQYLTESDASSTYATQSALSAHASSTSNPHAVTKTQVGLGNVDNTSDSDKPVSTATATAIATKQDTLVSGTNIKTINGSSILGSGNLVVGGGSGSGDMSMSTYDTDSDGIVDAAETAPWSGITGKPSTFAPSAHNHVLAEITNAGTAAALNTGTGAGQVVVLDGSAKLPAVDGSALTNLPAATPANGMQVGFASTELTTVQNYTSALIPFDDTIPQNTEGAQVFSLAYAAASTTNKLVIDIIVQASDNSADHGIGMALFNGSANAIACCFEDSDSISNGLRHIHLRKVITPGTTSSVTYTVRIGKTYSSGTITVNGLTSTTQKGGGVCVSSMTITEIKA